MILILTVIHSEVIKMQSQQKIPLLGLMTTLLIGLTSQSSAAFTITPSQPFYDIFNLSSGASKFYKRESTYQAKNLKITSQLSPIYVEELSLGGTQEFLQRLNSEFGSSKGWSYETGQNLNGSFDIEYYYACTVRQPCGGDLLNPRNGGRFSPINNGFGSAFQLRYIPGQGDPTSSADTLHWIQWVTNTGTDGSQDVIDIGAHTETPFYDATGAANEEYFVDRPYRYALENNNWTAQLYLVEQKDPINNPGKVTIYNGVKWGWSNQIEQNQDFCPAPGSKTVSKNDCLSQIDIGFLFDTTGSMGSSIGAAQSAANDILNQLEALGVDYRIAVADYKDFPEQDGYPYRAILPFSSEKTAITDAINSLSYNISGGGDWAESAYSGLIRTMHTEGLGSWRDEAKKSVIILTDAPPHDPEPHTGYTLKDVVDAAYAMGSPDYSENQNILLSSYPVKPVSIYSIISGGSSEPFYYFSKISDQTGGKTYRTSSSEDIVNALLDITGNIIRDETPQSVPENPQSVPEPSPVMGLWSMILAGFGLCRLRRKKQIISSDSL